jgi:hypothetical protein
MSRFKRSENDADNLALRLLRVMAASVVLGVAISLPFQTSRVTTGILLGGSLSLLNFHWLRSSIAAAFNRAQEGTRPQIRLAKYVLRYFVIGASVYTAYKLNLVSLPATIAGLSTFVVALFAEALRETYFIIRREGIY